MNHTPPPWNLPLDWFDPAVNLNASADKCLADAAPEMFAVLLVLVKAWEYDFKHDTPINGGDFLQWFCDIRPHILAAVAKASPKPPFKQLRRPFIVVKPK